MSFIEQKTKALEEPLRHRAVQAGIRTMTVVTEPGLRAEKKCLWHWKQERETKFPYTLWLSLRAVQERGVLIVFLFIPFLRRPSNSSTLIYLKVRIMLFCLKAKRKEYIWPLHFAPCFRETLASGSSPKSEEDPEVHPLSCPCLHRITAAHTSWRALWTQSELCTLLQLNSMYSLPNGNPRKLTLVDGPHECAQCEDREGSVAVICKQRHKAKAAFSWGCTGVRCSAPFTASFYSS